MLSAKWTMNQFVAGGLYQRTIAGRLQDVSDALTACAKALQHWDKQSVQVVSPAEAVRLAFTLYEGGSKGRQEVLTNDTTLYRAQRGLVPAQRKKARSTTTLYNVLRGGW